MKLVSYYSLTFNIPIPILAAVISFIFIYIGFWYETTNSIIKFKNIILNK